MRLIIADERTKWHEGLVSGGAHIPVAFLVGQAFLPATESVSGGTFLPLPNGFESARVARMPPLADSWQTRMSAPPASPALPAVPVFRIAPYDRAMAEYVSRAGQK